jgi:hypothetical protein
MILVKFLGKDYSVAGRRRTAEVMRSERIIQIRVGEPDACLCLRERIVSRHADAF